MKTRFNTYDIVCSLAELQGLIGMRVNNIYDIDNKTYLIRLQRSEEKSVLLLESGNRFHTTGYEWPKNMAPSGFSMKLRKHLKNKRLERLGQLGCDRIVDMQFGQGEAAYHIVLELFDRGNILLADHEWTILYVLRPHTEGDKFKFAVREKYPLERVRQVATLSLSDVELFFENAKIGEPLKKILMPKLEFGPSLLEHVLVKNGFPNSTKFGKDFDTSKDLERLHAALVQAEDLLADAKTHISKGFIIQKKEDRPRSDGSTNETECFYSNQDFHPLLYAQHETLPHAEHETFNRAVDEFFSTLQGQKIDMKALQQERDAIKKLENVRKDHTERLSALEQTQETDKLRAELITKNQQLVDDAIVAVQSAVASQMPWADIDTLVKDAAGNGDPIASVIKQLKLNTNHITLLLSDPYLEENDKPLTMVIDVDLALTAFANARRYYDQKRTAAKKQQKTIESQTKALKSAEKKTKQVLKEVQTTTSINKARKVYWFEKFFWFISSENYLVIAGRDQQQNELIVKRYMRPTDLYVHADIHGASSVVIKNPSGKPVPPKTLNEAGTMAICYSVAWEAKVLTNAYWVYGEQVSKSAPTGEYLTTGSFMVRGKKNFLPPSHLILGLGFLFRLEEASCERHKSERRVIAAVEEDATEDDVAKEEEEGEEIVVSDDGDSSDEAKEKKDEDEGKTEGTLETVQESEDESNFPDTQIKIQHTDGAKINILTESSALNKSEASDVEKASYQRSRTASEASGKNRTSSGQNKEVKEESKKQVQAKRGQRSKLKKIKEKYKDQDDEERQLRMTILQSAGPVSKKNKKNSKDNPALNSKGNPRGPKVVKPRVEKGETEIEDEPVVQADVDMIDALTGIPVAEDELLFAVPVVAPYNTLSQYKFKVKLTPGTSRRGKAAKTAVNMFLHDRTTLPREKDLLRAVKDESLARNLPGKVKLSAPRLQALRK